MDRIFLLGGMDLEMFTIKNILEKECCNYIDKHLSWSEAKLSAYTEEIQMAGEHTLFVGIELIEDVTTPLNYISIDHHNDHSKADSSLEQVMNLLNLKIERQELLIAANDKGYIDGMKAMGATDMEIREIRRKDRLCQGVTEEEEEEAERLVCLTNKENFPLMIHTKLLHFSPITDRLYPKNEYIIYNDKEMVYYGSMIIKKMISIFSKELRANNAYYGGSQQRQFFGLIYSKQEFEKYRLKMAKLIS